MVIFECNECANWGGANMHIVCGGHSGSSVQLLAIETTGGEIPVAFWPNHGL